MQKVKVKFSPNALRQDTSSCNAAFQMKKSKSEILTNTLTTSHHFIGCRISNTCGSCSVARGHLGPPRVKNQILTSEFAGCCEVQNTFRVSQWIRWWCRKVFEESGLRKMLFLLKSWVENCLPCSMTIIIMIIIIIWWWSWWWSWC